MTEARPRRAEAKTSASHLAGEARVLPPRASAQSGFLGDGAHDEALGSTALSRWPRPIWAQALSKKGA
jgi:hypothetical protein